MSISRSGDKITFTNTDTGSGSNTFIGLTDTPSSYTANKVLKVNTAGNGVIFADLDDQYDLEVVNHGSSTGAGSGNDTIIRLNPAVGDNDDVRLMAGSNVTLAHSTTADTITISTSAEIDVTQLNLNRIRFGQCY